jgi:dTDP-4-amino-4,6-dideoxygalactose transaminase
MSSKTQLALLGGPKGITLDQKDVFTWPIITPRHEEAALKVLRAGQMSGLDVTKEFEEKYAESLGRKFALTHPNATASILEAMFALGIGVGDQVISPSMTYWASILQVYNLGASPIFAEIDPDTLCIDPDDIEHRITTKTKAIVAVHYAGMPCDMDAIMAVAKRHNLKVIEDCSHAHGSLYKGRKVGTFGDVAAFSMMSGKSFAIGEAGIFLTDDRTVYERAILFGHYIRHADITLKELKEFAGLPCGGFKNRLNQICSAIGLVQLEMYPEQMAEIQKAMNYFYDQVEGIRGIRTIRPPYPDSTKGGWYHPLLRYVPDELGGLSLKRFADAISAEGVSCIPGCNRPLHLHPVFTKMDIYGHGRPTRIAHLDEKVKLDKYPESLPVTEAINNYVFGIPWFKHYRPKIIDEYANVYKKITENYEALLAGDTKEKIVSGGAGAYSSFFKEQKDNK